MISFDLECINGHAFEGWFKDSNAYEEQLHKKLIACPFCEDTKISKALSPFAIKKSDSIDNAPTSFSIKNALKSINNKIVEFVEKNFEDVGCNFTKEALKIHYGVSEPRNIRGVSTVEEEKVLKEEGIGVLKIAMPKDVETSSD